MKGLEMRYRRGLAFLLTVFMVLVQVLADVGTAYAANRNVIYYDISSAQWNAAIDQLKQDLSGEGERTPFSYDSLNIQDEDGSCEELLNGSDIYELSLGIEGKNDTSLRVFYDKKKEQTIALFINESLEEKWFNVRIDGVTIASDPICVKGKAYTAEDPVASGSNTSDPGSSQPDVASGNNTTDTRTPFGAAVVLSKRKDSGNLADFLKSVDIVTLDGNRVEGLMDPDAQYKVKLHFEEGENQSLMMRCATADELRKAGIPETDCADGTWMFLKLDGDIQAIDGVISEDSNVKIVNGGSAILYKLPKDRYTQEVDIEFTGTLKKGANLKDVTIVEGNSTVTFKPDPGTNIIVRKEAVGYDSKTQHIHYEVTVYNPTKETVTSLTVTDTITTEEAKLVSDSIKIDGEPVASAQVTVNENHDGFTLKSGSVELAPEGEVVISYDVDVSELVSRYVPDNSKKSFDVHNEVSVSPDGGTSEGSTPITDDETYTVFLGYLKKEGSIEKGTGLIHWDIRLYDPYQPLGGTKVTDVIPDDLTLEKVVIKTKTAESDGSKALATYVYKEDSWDNSVLHYNEESRKLEITLPEGVNTFHLNKENGDFNHIVKICVYTRYNSTFARTYENTATTILPSEGNAERKDSDKVPVGHEGVDIEKTGNLGSNGSDLEYTITVKVDKELISNHGYYNAGAAILDRLTVPNPNTAGDTLRVDTSTGMEITSFTASWMEGAEKHTEDITDITNYKIYSVYPYPQTGDVEYDSNGALIRFDYSAEQKMYGWTAIVIDPEEYDYCGNPEASEEQQKFVKAVKGKYPGAWAQHDVTLTLHYTIHPEKSYLEGERADDSGNYGWTGSGINTYKRGQTLAEYLAAQGDTVVSNKAYGIVAGHGDVDREELNLVAPLKKKGEVSVDPEDFGRIVTYSVSFHNGEQNDGAIPNDAEGIVFRDTFDEQMEFIGPIKVTRTYPDGSRTKTFEYQSEVEPVKDNQITASWADFVAPDGENLQHDFNQQGGQYTYCFTYRLKVKDSAALSAEKPELTIHNKAWMKWDGGKLASVEEDLEVRTGVLTKTAALKNGKVAFSVEINEQALKLSEGEWLTVTDEANQNGNLSLERDSLTVEKFENESWSLLEEGTGYLRNETSGDSMFSLQVPDQTHLRVSYEYVLTEAGKNAENVSITNGVTVTGKKPIQDEDVWSFQTSEINASASGSVYAFTLKKTANTTDGAGLQNAEFILYAPNSAWLDNKTAADEATRIGKETVAYDGVALEPVAVYKTGSDGTININWQLLTNNVNYALVEAFAPAGYQRMEEPVVFRVEEETTDDSSTAKLEILDAKAEMVTAGSDSNPMTMTAANKPAASVSLKVKKTIEGSDAPKDEKFTFILKQGEEALDTIEITGEGSKTFKTIQYEEEGTYNYTIVEEKGNAEGWTYDETVWNVTVVVEKKDGVLKATTTYTKADDSESSNETASFTNRYEALDLAVEKVWEDNDDQDGQRPESVTVQLFADGVAHGGVVTLNKANDWTYKWENLPKNAGEKEIIYTVEETNVPAGYTSEVEPLMAADGTETGFTITNTHMPEPTEPTVTRTVTKVWEDNGNQDNLRPTSIEVQLLADGTALGEPVVLNTENGWSHTWTNLPKNADGKEIAYTVEELGEITGYTASYSSDTFTITNTHIPVRTGDLSVTKTVSGNAAETDKAFRFTITLTPTSGAVINGTFGGMVFTNNQATVELKANETAKAVGLPEGIGYSVLEDTYREYEVTYRNGTGTIVAGETAEVVVNNNRSQEPTNPSNPTNPTNPSETSPENPTNPSETSPENPTNPSETSPENPTNPSETSPENPTNFNEPNPQNPTEPSPENPTEQAEPMVEIEEEEVPLADFPPVEIVDEAIPLTSAPQEEIFDEDVPLTAALPKTGDEAHAGLAGMLALVALGMMGMFGALSARKKDDAE